MATIKFNRAGKWSDRGVPGQPCINVAEGQELEVSDHLAKVVIDAKRGSLAEAKAEPETVTEIQEDKPAKKKPGPKPKSEKNPAVADKEASEVE